MKQKIILWAFIIISATNIVAQIIESPDLNFFTKPLLMPILLYYIFESAKGRVTMRILLLFLAVLLSWLGDIAMMYADQEVWFLAGIGLFLMAHVVYIIVLKKSSFQPLTFDVLKILPFALYATALFKFLIPGAGDFAIPVFVYGIVISVMAGTARLREGNTSRESYISVLIGAALFMISDSVLAINKFYGAIPFVGVWVMSTYITAQYFLVKGILNHVE